MATLIVADRDLRISRSVKEILESREGQKAEIVKLGPENKELGPNAPNLHYIVIVASFDELKAAINAVDVQGILVNAHFIDDKAGPWVQRLRSSTQKETNKNTHVIFFTYEENQVNVRDYLDSGMTDFIWAPFDWPVFKQKFDLHILGKGLGADRQFYSMASTKKIDLAKMCPIVQISEIGATLKSTETLKTGEFVILHGECFGNNATGEVTAKVLKCDAEQNLFNAELIFVGVSSGILQNIRRWLRQEYALKKQKSG